MATDRDETLSISLEDSGGTVAEHVVRDPRLDVVSESPFNAESILARHVGVVTPNAACYVRNHFRVPSCSIGKWRLAIGGLVKTPMEITYEEVRALPSRSIMVTLECAGNGRAAMRPRAEGEQWRYGAVSTANWTGVPLRVVLDAAGLLAEVCEIVVEGADRGHVDDASCIIPFARSLPLKVALHPDTLLAYAMNGETLPAEHGYPVRLIVPGWYGVASVKWVARLEAAAQPYRGFYQVDRYVMTNGELGEAGGTPLTRMAVRSVITTPTDGAELPCGRQVVRGLAWSGAAPVHRVEVSVDGGATWAQAVWTSESTRYAWRSWECEWSAKQPGEAILQSRARDAAANVQPATALWNRLGYANNAIQSVRLFII
jgi:DMSO/TMAO reductase YedYZ molybdopterin-dependent catalytic subunit